MGLPRGLATLAVLSLAGRCTAYIGGGELQPTRLVALPEVTRCMVGVLTEETS